MTATVEKLGEIMQAAEKLYADGKDWVTFYRETLGLYGVVRQEFPALESWAEFDQTEAYQRIQQILTELRKRGTGTDVEPTRVITVRIPQSMHEALRREAHEYCTSMNRLCISKLLQFIDNQMVPKDHEMRAEQDGDEGT
jgi:predicted HicB family RNase H-like nuclease